MNGNQIEGLIGMVATLGILVLLVLPSVIGIVRDRRVDRQLRQSQKDHGRQGSLREEETQKSSSRSTVPSTATWYADGRRSKKFVSS
ncbi:MULTISPECIES: hypothetical protein [unclassified Streptomyces]|uniref:hypothetical protein n=1 Tax=unclassified Streptomyces TaxID=2593676 RepID=UPI002E2CA550|nr:MULTISPECIES: hypothetical protein [unclassified Streptomyces]WUB86880.1 hypothetical protein OG812_09870 [Streptomyces sp. NBC_00566]